MSDNLETYIYIFFAVIYIISRIIKARAKQNKQQSAGRTAPQQVHPQTARNTPPPKKAFSFDDILKEFEKNLSGEEFQEEKSFPVEEIRHEKPVPIAVKAIEEKPNPYQKYRNKVKEPSSNKIDRKEPAFERNEKFAIKEVQVSPFIKMLQNPEGFRNAVVMNEIINRKYF